MGHSHGKASSGGDHRHDSGSPSLAGVASTYLLMPLVVVVQLAVMGIRRVRRSSTRRGPLAWWRLRVFGPVDVVVGSGPEATDLVQGLVTEQRSNRSVPLSATTVKSPRFRFADVDQWLHWRQVVFVPTAGHVGAAPAGAVVVRGDADLPTIVRQLCVHRPWLIRNLIDMPLLRRATPPRRARINRLYIIDDNPRTVAECYAAATDALTEVATARTRDLTRWHTTVSDDARSGDGKDSRDAQTDSSTQPAPIDGHTTTTSTSDVHHATGTTIAGDTAHTDSTKMPSERADSTGPDPDAAGESPHDAAPSADTQNTNTPEPGGRGVSPADGDTSVDGEATVPGADQAPDAGRTSDAEDGSDAARAAGNDNAPRTDQEADTVPAAVARSVAADPNHRPAAQRAWFATSGSVPRIVVKQPSPQEARNWRLGNLGGTDEAGCILWSADAFSSDELMARHVTEQVLADRTTPDAVDTPFHLMVVGDNSLAASMLEQVQQSRWNFYELLSAERHGANITHKTEMRYRTAQLDWLTNPTQHEYPVRPVGYLHPHTASLVLPQLQSVHVVGRHATDVVDRWQAHTGSWCGVLAKNDVPRDTDFTHVDLGGGPDRTVQRHKVPDRKLCTKKSESATVEEYISAVIDGRTFPDCAEMQNGSQVRQGDHVVVVFATDRPWVQDVAAGLQMAHADRITVWVRHPGVAGATRNGTITRFGPTWMVHDRPCEDSWGPLVRTHHARMMHHELGRVPDAAYSDTAPADSDHTPLAHKKAADKKAGKPAVKPTPKPLHVANKPGAELTRLPWTRPQTGNAIPDFIAEDLHLELRQLLLTLQRNGTPLIAVRPVTTRSVLGRQGTRETPRFDDAVVSAAATTELNRWAQHLRANGWHVAPKRCDSDRQHHLLSAENLHHEHSVAWVKHELLVHLERLWAHGYQPHNK